MFCYQCQETAKNTGCTVKGVCGKDAQTANLQDFVIYNLKGISQIILTGQAGNITFGKLKDECNHLLITSLFATITNANFNPDFFIKTLDQVFVLKEKILDMIAGKKTPDGKDIYNTLHAASKLLLSDKAKYADAQSVAGVLSVKNEDIRSLRELLIYGIKGIAAYYHHADMLSHRDESIIDFIYEGLSATLDDTKTADELTGLVLKCGSFGVKVMTLLDTANTQSFGTPEPSQVNLGTGTNPGILVSGHDLRDMEELLIQTNGTGIDVYTHGEMLPAHYYPKLKKYPHLKGNYGGSWWKQQREFEKFNGPILMTTNCIVQPKDTYKNRIFTSGAAGYPGITHIPDRTGSTKDFSQVIALAKKCGRPEELEKGTITGGFAHAYVISIADKVLDAVKSGAIKKFVVMAGCDGRQKARDYYTDFAEKLPSDTVILTAGCAKYRYNKLNLGSIGGIPRVLDAGQCNDSYSLAVIALKLAEVLKVGVNDLPIVYNIAWYEQKAVIVLLALLSLGVKNIHLGPTLPAFLSPNVAKVLVEKFAIGGITDAATDVKAMAG